MGAHMARRMLQTLAKDPWLHVRNLVPFSGLVALFLLTGCDPGYSYRAINRERTGERWSQTIEGVEFESRVTTTLIGSRYIMGVLTVSNHSAADVTVIGGTLTTNGTVFTGKLQDGEQAVLVQKGSTQEVGLDVDLGTPASNVLAPSIVWTWRVKIGTKEHAVAVETVRKP